MRIGVPEMCDYSLDDVQSRAAEVDDKLVTAQFRNTITRGFSAIEHPYVAVCLRPGTEIAFEGEVRTGWGELLLSFFKKNERLIPDKLARFRLINLDDPSTHHDALEFSDGQ